MRNLLVALIVFASLPAQSEVKVVIVGSGGIDFQSSGLKRFDTPTSAEFVGAIDGWNAYTQKPTTYQNWFRESINKNFVTIKEAFDVKAAAQAGDLKALAILEANGGNNTTNNTFNFYQWPYNVTQEARLIYEGAPQAVFQAVNVLETIHNSDVAVTEEMPGNTPLIEIFASTERYLNLVKPQIVKMDLVFYKGLNGSEIKSLCDIMSHNPSTLFVLPVGFTSKGKVGKDENDLSNMPWPARCGAENSITVTIADLSGSLPTFADYGSKAIDVASYGLDVKNPTLFGTPIKLYGTCVATNFVVSAAVRTLAAQQNLQPRELKKAIVAEAQSSESLKDKVISGKYFVPTHR